MTSSLGKFDFEGATTKVSDSLRYVDSQSIVVSCWETVTSEGLATPRKWSSKVRPLGIRDRSPEGSDTVRHARAHQ